MRDVAITYPMFVQVALTLGLLVWTGVARTNAIRRREVRIEAIARDSRHGRNASP